MNFKSPYISREKLHHFTPYSDSLYYTKYQDSVKNVIFNPSNKGPIIIPKPQYIGKIERGSILKYDKKGPIRAFIFESDLFDSYLSQEPGLWVAYSSDDGNSWEYLYTGIVQRQPICLKWYSAIPLIKSENELEMEACLLRQLTPFYSLDYRPTYKLIKDRLKVTLDLNTLRKDTDGDGLSDIIETKFCTNLNNTDTDGDSITDNIDLNPRISVPRTDKTVIYEALVNEEFDRDTLFNFKPPHINFASSTTKTILIVTDNPDLQSIQPKFSRVIFLSEVEYKQNKGRFQNSIEEYPDLQLYKVNNQEDTYKLSIYSYGAFSRYILKKTNKGWRKYHISSEISDSFSRRCNIWNFLRF
ncbi:MAG TPA: hypothetical protein VK172_13150 [Lentimicrobium sp.]|nr:hypothetical protein [Lentimicrobium sp.]